MIIRDIHQQMLYGLGKWFGAYEGSQFNSLWEASRWVLKFGLKIPRNDKEEFANLMTLNQAQPTVVPTSYIRDKLRKMGYEDMPDEATIATLIQNEATARAQTALDPEAQRLEEEANALADEGA